MAFTKEQIKDRLDEYLNQHPEGTIYSMFGEAGTHHFKVSRLEDRV